MTLEIGKELAETIKMVIGMPLIVLALFVGIPWGLCAIAKKYGRKYDC